MHTLKSALDAELNLMADRYNATTSAQAADLAAELADRTPDAAQRTALRVLVEDAVSSLVAGSCLLDECDDESYSLVAEVAFTLTHAIVRQGRTEAAFRELAAAEIESRGALRYLDGPGSAA